MKGEVAEPMGAVRTLTAKMVNNAYLAAKSPWLQRQLHAPLGLGDLPFIVGGACCRGRAASVAA